MTTAEFYYIARLFGMAFFGAVCLGLAAAIAIDAGLRIRRYGVILILLGVVVAITLGTALSGRNLALAYVGLENAFGGGGGRLSVWMQRAMSFGLLALSASLIVNTFIRRDPLVRGGTMLLLAFIVYHVSNILLNGALGSRPSFSHNTLYPLFIVWGIHAARDVLDYPQIVRTMRNLLVAFVVLSCLAVAIKSSLVVQQGYRGLLPGISFRLWGLGSHANSFGPLCLLAMVLLYLEPIRWRVLQWLIMGLAFAAFVLAQSKTAYIAFVVMLGYLLARSMRQDIRLAMQGGVAAMRLTTGLRMAAIVVSGILLLVLPMALDLGSSVEKLMATREGAEIATLTGRGLIWQVAINAWQDNPLFGYGPAMWDALHRYTLGMAFAYSAHNQFIHSLGSAGLIGFAGLLFYLGVLSVLSFRHAEQSRGGTLLILILILVRSISEVPLLLTTVTNGDFLTQLLLFTLLMTFEQQRTTHHASGERTIPGAGKHALA